MRVDVSGRKFKFPTTCACCGAAADGELDAVATRTTGVKVVRTHSRAWSIPYCAACRRHIATFQTSRTSAKAGLYVLLAGIVVLWLFESLSAFAIVVVGLLLVGLAIWSSVHAARQRLETCTDTGPAARYLGWDGSVQLFDFSSASYAARFAASNAKKVVNATADLRGAIEALSTTLEPAAEGSRATMAAPPSSAPEAERDVLLRWITKIEGLKGPTSRKNALQRATEEIHSPEVRAELRKGALEIEVHAALDKFDRLKTLAAKRRTLKQAAEYVHSAEVTEDVKAAQAAVIEQALRDLEADQQP